MNQVMAKAAKYFKVIQISNWDKIVTNKGATLKN
jgi:hypothetical protein